MTLSRFVGRLVNCGLISGSMAIMPLQVPEVHAAQPLIISEVAWAGSSISAADEWIEICNLSQDNMPLTGLSLVVADKSPIFFPEDAVVPAQGTYLIANYTADNENSALDVEPQIATATLSLSNTSLKIALLDPNQIEIDLAGDGGAPDAGYSSTTKASMIRDGDSFITSFSSVGFDEGVLDLGTPGLCDAFLPKNYPAEEVEEGTLPPQNYELLRLNKFMPDPNEESEWVEIVSLDPETPVMLQGLELHDALNTIYTYTSGTLDVANPVVRVYLSASKLNNGGDTLSLYDPSGNLLDEFTYEESVKDSPWMRDPDGTGDWMYIPAPTSTESVIEEEVEPEPEEVPQDEEESESLPPQSYELLRLNKFMADPDGGAEWVEIVTLNPETPVMLEGLELHDSLNKIYAYTSGTLDVVNPFVRIYLSGSKLNNGGDTVSLFDPSGNLLDEFTYEESDKNSLWMRDPDGTGDWMFIPAPTSTEPIVDEEVDEESQPESEETPDPGTSYAGSQTPDESEVASPVSSSESGSVSASESETSDAGSQTPDEQESAPQFDLVRINEFMPDPDGEAEWVEVTSLDLNTPVALQGMELYDALNKIFTFDTEVLDSTNPFVRVYLSSSKLNNGGDTLSLYDPSGNLLNQVVYESSEKAMSWARNPDATGEWTISEPTPGQTNQPSQMSTETGDANEPEIDISTQTQADPAQTSGLTSLSVYGPVVTEQSNNTPEVTTTPKITTVIPEVAKKPVVEKTPSTAKKTSTTKTTTTKTASTEDETKPITFTMAHDEENAGIRVSLKGVIGSQPGLMSGHRFILLSPDGRGLLVRVPTTQKLPEAGKMIEVTGKIMFDDLGVPSIKFNKGDGWIVLNEVPKNIPARAVDMSAPSTEDAWSMVSIEGTVVSVKGSTVTLDTKDGEVEVYFNKVVDYRATRLTEGDTVRISGLLDVSGSLPKIMPRSQEEVTILSHVKPAPEEKAPATLPGWTPFGAAGLAIAGTESVKQLRQRRRRRSLEKMLETDISG
ncbi:lamin tail domain-containing protein [Patescibacteria group bacterium]|nr:lamin tail domain-containing protein [Patescibacteria group bacterium]